MFDPSQAYASFPEGKSKTMEDQLFLIWYTANKISIINQLEKHKLVETIIFFLL
jgi:hypothetical protein